MTRQTNPEVFHSTAHEIIWAPTGLTPVISEAPYIQKHKIFGNFCDMMKIQCLSCHLMGEPSKSLFLHFLIFFSENIDGNEHSCQNL